MSLNISSEKIDNPLLIELLRQLNQTFARIGSNFYAEDMWYIVDNYYFANEERGIHPEVYELDGFDLTIGGAYWMAHDIADLLSSEQIAYYADILRNEIGREEDSRLVVQILETHKTVTSSDVLKVLLTISDVFSKRLTDDRS